MNVIILNSSSGVDFTARYLGIYQIAFWARKHGFSCQVIDYLQNIDYQSKINVIEKFIDKSTKVLAVSTTFHDDGLQDVLLYFKKKYKLKIVAGGSGTPKPNLESIADKKFFRTCENEFMEYLFELFEKDKTKIIPFEITKCDHKWADNDFITHKEPLPLEMGRGCIFKCKFCSYDKIGKKKGTYIRDLDLIEDEIMDSYERFGTETINITDDTINEDPNKIRFLADLNDRLPFDLKWGGYLRLDLIHAHKNEEDFLRSGLVTAYFGIESFHPQAAKVIGKGFNGTKAKEYLTELKEVWGEVPNFNISLIAGLPHEPLESMEESVDWIIKSDVPASCRLGVLQLYKSARFGNMFTSEFQRNAEQYGYVYNEKKNSWYNNITGLDTAICAKNVKVWNNRLMKRNRIAGFGMMGIHHDSKLPHSELAKMNRAKYVWKHTRTREYFKLLESY